MDLWNTRAKLVWLADAVCVAYFHAQTGTAVVHGFVCVCVCGGCVAVWSVPLSTKMF